MVDYVKEPSLDTSTWKPLWGSALTNSLLDGPVSFILGSYNIAPLSHGGLTNFS